MWGLINTLNLKFNSALAYSKFNDKTYIQMRLWDWNVQISQTLKNVIVVEIWVFIIRHPSQGAGLGVIFLYSLEID